MLYPGELSRHQLRLGHILHGLRRVFQHRTQARSIQVARGAIHTGPLVRGYSSISSDRASGWAPRSAAGIACHGTRSCVER